MTRQNVSCIFYFEKRIFSRDKATGRSVVVTNADSSIRTNANFISFLQVISAYWETLEKTNKRQLNIFLNGGSVSRDHETGEATMKSGYTVVVPEFVGTRFMEEWYGWAQLFGITPEPVPTVPVSTPRRENRNGTNRRSESRPAVNEAEYVDPSESPEGGFVSE